MLPSTLSLLNLPFQVHARRLPTLYPVTGLGSTNRQRWETLKWTLGHLDNAPFGDYIVDAWDMKLFETAAKSERDGRCR